MSDTASITAIEASHSAGEATVGSACDENVPLLKTEDHPNLEKMDGSNMDTTNNEEMKEEKNQIKEKTDKSEEGNDNETPDPFAYANNGETFTSESFKIEIMNLPKYCGFKQLRKRLNTLNVDPVKIKIPYKASYGFATFRSEEERQAAITVIEGHKWKGTTFRAKKAAPSADPLLRKRKIEAAASSGDTGRDNVSKKPRMDDSVEEITAEERLKNAVTPTWRQPYDRQLVLKERNMRNFLSSLSGDIIRNNHGLQSWVNGQKRKYGGIMCELVTIKASPQTTEYRNKCEFTVGRSVEGKEKTLGFRLGSYREGTVHVMSPEACGNIPPAMKKVVKAIEQYLQQVSPHSGFDPEGKDGNWRMVTVRTNTEAQVMVVMHFNPMQLTQEEIEEEKQRIKAFFVDGDGKEGGVTSLYFQIKNEHRTRGAEDNVQGKYELLDGDEYIHESLLGLKFQISPAAFFQVNTPAAEVLYSTVREWADIGTQSTVLDVCCGTGTIGITMAKHVKQVIGIEMCKEAVDDARINAEINGVRDVTTFHCGKAEDVLPGLIKTIDQNEDVVAIVDPPRGGLHRDVMKALRKHEFVKRLVYVSCKATSIRNNIIDLMRQQSKQIKGEPFRLTSAVPVDLFPDTDHCELIMLFERGQRKPQPEKEENGGKDSDKNGEKEEKDKDSDQDSKLDRKEEDMEKDSKGDNETRESKEEAEDEEKEKL